MSEEKSTAQKPWYAAETDTRSNLLVLRFLHEGAPFLPSVISEFPLPGADRFAGRAVRLEGKTAMWIYAHSAAHAVSMGAASVEVVQPFLPEPVRVWPLDSRTPEGDEWLKVSRALPHQQQLVGVEFQAAPGSEGKWSPDVLAGLAARLGDIKGADVAIGGRGPNWMYAAVAAGAISGGASLVACQAPLEGPELVAVGGNMGARGQRLQDWTGMFTPLPSPGLVLGIVGDPNSGKSVLARMMFHALRVTFGNKVWCLDCDAASPTPNWYLDMERQGDEAGGRAVRDPQKRGWTAGMESRVASELKQCRRCLEVTLADLPGGRHFKDGRPSQRLPAGREVIMREVDRFIVLYPAGRPEVSREWRHALAAHGLADRIVAEIESLGPDAPLDAQLCLNELPVHGQVRGLDRSKPLSSLSEETGQVLRKLVQVIQGTLERGAKAP